MFHTDDRSARSIWHLDSRFKMEPQDEIPVYKIPFLLQLL